MLLRPAALGMARQLQPLFSFPVCPLWGPLAGQGSTGKAELA